MPHNIELPNLYQFLRRILIDAKADPLLGAVVIQDDEIEWLEKFLQPADFELHFKATKMEGGDPDNPVYAQHYQVVGDGADIFSLLTEAMLQNHQFADQVVHAAQYYRDHVPRCPSCSKRHFSQERPVMDWTFKPHTDGNSKT